MYAYVVSDQTVLMTIPTRSQIFIIIIIQQVQVIEAYAEYLKALVILRKLYETIAIHQRCFI